MVSIAFFEQALTRCKPIATTLNFRGVGRRVPQAQGDNVMQAGGGSIGDLKNNPPDHPEYESPKGGDRKVRNPNGRGTGWVDGKGRVWVPEDHNGTHAPHWDRQEPKGGGYTPVYPYLQPSFPSIDPTTIQRSLWITVGAAAGAAVIEYGPYLLLLAL